MTDHRNLREELRKAFLMEFIRLGQEIMRWDRQGAYGADFTRVAPSPPALGVASPGFLGREYRGLVVLNQNPGLGARRGSEHRIWDRLLTAWRDEGTIEAYDEAFKFYLADFRHVAVWRQWVEPVLDAAGLGAHAVAYLNLGKSVLRKNEPPKPPKARDPIFEADWRWTRAQLDLLEPDVVLAGKAVANLLSRYWPNPPFDVIVQDRARSQNKATRAARAREHGDRIRAALAALAANG